MSKPNTSDESGTEDLTNTFHWNLPVELTAAILSCIDNETNVNYINLAACSLVCRLWNELARPALFSRLEVRITVQEVEDDTPGTDAIPISRLTRRLEETVPSIVQYVKKLVLLQQTADDDSTEKAFTDEAWETVDSEVLMSILRYFPSLKRLHFMDLVLAFPPDVATTRPLDLDEVQYTIHSPETDLVPANQFIWMLGLFGSIEKLYVEGMGYGEQSTQAFPLPTLRVRSFSSGRTGMLGAFLAALSRSPSAKVLESMDLTDFSPATIKQLADVVRNSPNGLTHIGLKLAPVRNIHGQITKSIIVDILGGPKMTSLRSLRFNLDCFRWARIPPHALLSTHWDPRELEVTVKALEAIAGNRSPPLQLDFIHLELTGPMETWSAAIPWGSFSAIEPVLLRLPRFKKLIISDAHHAHCPSHINSALRTACAILDKQGRLEIV